MRKFLKWAGYSLLLLVCVALLLPLLAWINSARSMARVYAISDAPLSVPGDIASIDHGRHLFVTRGCGDCHDAQGQGREVLDAGPLGRIVAPNITPARLHLHGYTPDRIAAAVRHGLRADGTPLIFMPSGDWSEMGDSDVAALVAFMATLPVSEHAPGATEIRLLGRVLHLLGKFPLLPAEDIDHAPRTRIVPAAARTLEFGQYVARNCVGCHGEAFAGGPPMGPGLPAVADLTPAALGQWSEADFVRALREGKRPDGSAIDPFMPWPALGQLTDTELGATWLYLSQLPASGIQPRR